MPQATKNLRDGILHIYDDAEANKITLALEEGNLSFEEFENVINVLDRGDLSHMRKGDEQPVTLSFSLKFIELIKQTGGSDATLYEFVKQIGTAAAYTSTNTDGGDVYTFDAHFIIVSPTTGEDNEKVVFTKCHGRLSFAEGDEYNTLTFEGEAFITAPTVSKTTTES